MFFWNSLAFSMIQWLLAIWSLVPLPFLKPALLSLLFSPLPYSYFCSYWKIWTSYWDFFLTVFSCYNVVIVHSLSHVQVFEIPRLYHPGLPVHHHLPELSQVHLHWISDAIQPSHPLLPSSPLPLQSFPASRSFTMSRLFTSGGQSFGASTSVLPMNIQDWFPLGLPGLISLLSEGLWRVFSSTTVQKLEFFHVQPSLWSNYHTHTRQTFIGKVMSLLFNTFSRFAIAFLPRTRVYNFMAIVTISSDFRNQEEKNLSLILLFPFNLTWSNEVRCHDLSFLNVLKLVLSQLFHSPPLPSSRGSLVPLHFLPLQRYHLLIWGCCSFSQQSWFQLVIHQARHYVWYILHIRQINRVTIYSIVWNSQSFHGRL